MTVMMDKKSEMAMGALPNEQRTEPSGELNTQTRRIVRESQKTIYTLLLDVVRRKHPTFVLALFKDLFINLVDDGNSTPAQALQKIVAANNEDEFRNTLKRCCYILVNNWEVARQYHAVLDLIQIFDDPVINQPTPFGKLSRARRWLRNFINSQDYEELKIFSLKHEEQEQKPWSYRYSSYLLVPQYLDRTNPIEQRKAAKKLAKKLKEKFKFDLAMYTARAASASGKDKPAKNPTNLGDEVVNLVKMIVVKRGQFNYVNLANIFLEQTQNLTYREFKISIKKYLIFSIGNKELATTIKASLDKKLNSLYEDYNDEPVSKVLLLKTCERLIEYLTTENHQTHSELFILLIFQKTLLTLVILLLKIVLICQPCRLHLEACIADLIRHYENLPEEECKWVINFLDVFNITFTIYAENVEYNLIKVNNNQPLNKQLYDWENYRVFSQVKEKPKLSDRQTEQQPLT